MDLVIRGGTVVTTGSIFAADIGIEEGKVAQIGGQMSAPREIDATGKLVLPGGVDVHVHLLGLANLGNPARAADDMYWGTVSAAVGGITTVANMTYTQSGEGLLAALERTAQEAAANSLIDFTQHPILADPSPANVAEFPRLLEAGYGSIKVFMTRDAFDARVGEFIRAIEAAGRQGMITLIHCEDLPIITFCEHRLLAEGKTDIRYYPESRPDYSEAVATARATALAETTGAPVYIVHVSSAAALEECRQARAKGLPVYVETRPVYLYLTKERYLEPDAAKYVCYPPLREPADVRAVWDGLRDGLVDTLCTDEVPWTLAEKLDPQLKVGSFRPGMGNLETLMPMLYSEGVRTGRISLSRFVELTSTNAAKLFGMFPQKGTIALGSDADLVVWDPERRRTIRASEMHSNAGFDVYEGWEVWGWPVSTISRGEILVEDGKVTAHRGRGQPVRRGPFMPL